MDSALWEWRQEGCEFKGCLSYTVKPFQREGKTEKEVREGMEGEGMLA